MRSSLRLHPPSYVEPDGMTPERFFDLFLEELRSLPELSRYYKYHSSVKEDFEFRKAYFLQRLKYVSRHLEAHAPNSTTRRPFGTSAAATGPPASTWP